MRRQFTSFALMVCGVVALALGMTVAPAATPAAAMPAMQPSPRPTLVPTADVIPSDDDDGPAPVRFGRVTGTVIDSRTGAPASGKRVVVGDALVTSDGNGNYDHWIAPGAYAVGLQLREGEGVTSQGTQQVTVAAGGTIVQHLYFTSPAPALPTALPTAAPTAVPTVAPTAPVVPTEAAMPTAAPVAVAEATAVPAVVLPAEIPDTSVAADAPAAAVPAAAARGAAAPKTLPDTAFGGAGFSAGFVLVGALLFGLGVLLQVRPRRRAASPARVQADSRMLRRMLTSAPRQTPEETLDELLRRDPQE